MTHTYVVLEISVEAYNEIRSKLDAAGYQHAFHKERGVVLIDMHGIALKPSAEPTISVKLEK